MRCLITFVLALTVLWMPCLAQDGAQLKESLPDDAYRILEEIDPNIPNVKQGVSALLNGAKAALHSGLKSALGSAFLIASACLLLSFLQTFAKSAGIQLPGKVCELTGTTVILLLALEENGTLLSLCERTVSRLETFTELLTTVFAIASAAAGRPASAAATAGAAMLFSNVILTLSLRLFLPAVTLYLLLVYGGAVAENGTLRQAAAVGKWAVTTFFKVFLTSYFAYLTFTSLVSGSADAAAVKTAQSLSSTVPLVGSVIAGASETILSGAALLRAGVGFFGFLGAAAICLTPFLQGVCHLLVFRVLSVFAASFAEGGTKTMLDGLADAYGMLVGIMTACCAVQFITIVVSLTVAGI